MRTSETIEQLVAEAIPHEYAECGITGPCYCKANAKRNKLLLHINAHVDRMTRGRVYLR